MVKYILCTLLLTICCVSNASVQYFIVDFEGFDEGTEISDQYANIGIEFDLPENSGTFPVIAIEGEPQYGFKGSGVDSPVSSGIGCLTDPIIDGDAGAGQDISMIFTEPVTSVSFYIIDIDVDDVFTAYAYNDGVLVDSETHDYSEPASGDGKSTLYSLYGNIDEVVIDVPSRPVGFALDFITFTRPCTGENCSRLVQVSQESLPGAGDFSDNVLGYLTVFQTTGSAQEFYAYDIPEGSSWNGRAFSPVADRSHLLFADTTDGTTLVISHDRAIPDDANGGRAEMKFVITGKTDGVFMSVIDDQDDIVSGPHAGDPNEIIFTTQHQWDMCCTDGLAISDLEKDWIVDVVFTNTDSNNDTDAIEGLTHWMAISADGRDLPLSLEEDRWVRLSSGQGCQMKFAGDINGDCVVDIEDLALLADNWLAGVR